MTDVLRERERRLGERVGKLLVTWVWGVPPEWWAASVDSAQGRENPPANPLSVIRGARDYLSRYLADAEPGRDRQDEPPHT